ncbi:conserved hypothetical protein [Rhodococcus sp. RD6.2]|uniref:MBL fold metallo-hydrolase n=1 Tax=Rhodococcus sp. RD6.2 TaxID=260936 RepID=UPI00063BB103|nr:MBL fold metallo-hydrolase [Rhodococcus sp. RD6.2]CRK54560.1 conserved hypothetical protein [Rhodococcus sp. RD6.2]
MTDWYRVTPIAHGIWSITEPGHVTMWLIAGTERALLVDTGMGFVPLRPVVTALTPLPVTVVNTHYHFDHVAGNHEFDDVRIHPAGVEPLRVRPARQELDAYLDHNDRLLLAAAGIRDTDRDLLYLLDADSDPATLPASFDRTTWTVHPPAPSATVVDDDLLDLGGRTVRVLHTPGHTPDSLCLHDSRTGVLFGGDTVNSGPIYAHEPDSNLADFAASTARLAEVKDDVSLVAMNHFGRVVAPPYVLQSVADAFARIVEESPRQEGSQRSDQGARRQERSLRSDQGTRRRVRDVQNNAADEIRFDHFSITVPPK